MLASILAAAAVGAADDESRCDAATLREGLRVGQYQHPVWAALQTFRSLSADCGEDPSASNDYWAHLAQLESFVGNHALALSYFGNRQRRDRSTQRISLPADVRAVPAAAYIADRARDHRVVIVNERHHASSDRLLTLNLLDALAALGFRYLALEAFSPVDNPTNERGYPIRQSGYYVNDVVFAELVRSAVDHGFEIVAYEIEGHQWQSDKDRGVTEGFTARRQYWQGRNIVDRVFANDPDAKVLVHCGWGHVRESGSRNGPKMAEVLARLTGLDPLTVDQIAYADRGDADDDHPLRAEAEARNLIGDEDVVLLAGDGDPVPLGDPAYVDVRVFARRTHYQNGRPTWMEMDGRRRAVAFATPDCDTRPCVVEARSVLRTDAVAFDRVEVRGEATTLYVPPGGGSLGRVFRLDGSLIAERPIAVSAGDSPTAQKQE